METTPDDLIVPSGRGDRALEPQRVDDSLDPEQAAPLEDSLEDSLEGAPAAAFFEGPEDQAPPRIVVQERPPERPPEPGAESLLPPSPPISWPLQPAAAPAPYQAPGALEPERRRWGDERVEGDDDEAVPPDQRRHEHLDRAVMGDDPPPVDPASKQLVRPLVVLAVLLLASAAAGGGVVYFDAQTLQAQRAEFLRLHEIKSEHDPETLWVLFQELDPRLQEDAALAGLGERLRERVRGLAARQRSAALLDGVSPESALEDRRTLAQRALERDPSFTAARVVLARTLWRIRNREVRPGRLLSPAEIIQPALREVELGLREDPESAALALLEAQLLMAENNASGRVSSALRRVMDLDPEGALGALAQGLLEASTQNRARGGAERSGALEPAAGYEGGRSPPCRNWRAAIRHYGVAIRRDPELVEAYVRRGQAYLEMPNFGRAYSDADTAVELDQSSADARVLLAEARYLASGRRDREGALRNLDLALRLQPGHAHARALRAFARLKRDTTGWVVSGADEQQRAVEDATFALQLDPNQDLALLALSEVAAAQGDLREAARLATRAISKKRRALGYMWRGRLRGRDGDLENAMSDFEQVARLTRDDRSAHWIKARALAMQSGVLIERKRFSEAKEGLDRAVLLDPSLAEAYLYRGLANHKDRKNRELEQAIADYTHAISLSPTLGDAFYHRAAAYIDLESWEQALPDLDECLAIDTFSGPVYVHFMKGKCYYELERWGPARSELERFLDEAPVGSPAYQPAKDMLGEIPAEVELDVPRGRSWR